MLSYSSYDILLGYSNVSSIRVVKGIYIKVLFWCLYLVYLMIVVYEVPIIQVLIQSA